MSISNDCRVPHAGFFYYFMSFSKGFISLFLPFFPYKIRKDCGSFHASYLIFPFLIIEFLNRRRFNVEAHSGATSRFLVRNGHRRGLVLRLCPSSTPLWSVSHQNIILRNPYPITIGCWFEWSAISGPVNSTHRTGLRRCTDPRCTRGWLANTARPLRRPAPLLLTIPLILLHPPVRYIYILSDVSYQMTQFLSIWGTCFELRVKLLILLCYHDCVCGSWALY